MPLYDYRCPAGHFESSRYVGDKNQADAQVCRECGIPTIKMFSVGAGRMLFFEEGRARHIRELGDGKVPITSYKQHSLMMKEAGVDYATKDDMLHSIASDSINKAKKKREHEPGWMKQYMPHPASGVRRGSL